MTASDLEWVVDLARERRELLVELAPRFWRPADGATARHRDYLSNLIADPEVVSVRTGQGFLIAIDPGDGWLVDDAAMAASGEWADDGVALLRQAQERCGALRFVVPVFETDRMAAGLSVGLAPVEHWWHRDLDAGPGARAGAGVEPEVVVVQGAEGRLVQAPPVFDPGGPVLLVTEVRDAPSLGRIEAAAAGRGATVSVVTQRPGDTRMATLLRDAGYVLTTAFCEATRGP